MSTPQTLPEDLRDPSEPTAAAAPSATEPTAAAPAAAERAPSRRRTIALELAWAAGAAAVALAGAALTLRLWRAHLNVPFSGGGDVMLALMTVKNMETGGWAQFGAGLGAPFGQDLAAYPSSVGDLWHLLTLKLLSLVLSPAATVNVFFVGGFAVIALFAYAALRSLTVSRPLACALAAVYSWLPYHFLRGESHLFLSAYYAVPVAVALAVALYAGRVDVWRSPRRWRVREWGVIVSAVLVAGTGLYYAVFSVVLVVAAGLLAAIAHRSWRPALTAGVHTGTVLVVLALAALPNLLYEPEPGSGFAIDGRSYGATEFYGLKIANLLLPLGRHRIAELGSLRGATVDSPIPGEGSETLGALGALGLVIAVVALLVPIGARAVAPLLARLRALGALTVVMVLAATVAGLNSVLAALGFAELRAWNRASVVVAFLALAALGLTLDALLTRVTRERARRTAAAVTVAAAGLVGAVGLYDQTSDAMVPDYAGTAFGWNRDIDYFREVEAKLGSEAMVFNLPYAPFPEHPPIVNMADYSHLRGYIHSNLSWSYGGVKGQEAEWQPAALGDGITAALPRLVAAGFDAVYVNRLGYADRGAAIEAEIRAETGSTRPVVNYDATLATYDLRAYGERLRKADALPDPDSVLEGPRLVIGEGVYGVEEVDGTRWNWAEQQFQVGITNPGDEEARIRLTGEIVVASPGAEVAFHVAGRTTAVVAGADGTAKLDLTVSVPAESLVEVDVSTDSMPTPGSPGDVRSLYVRLVELDVAPA
ncbi:hypothetical protein [Cellulomonas xiejunii]|uniref:hypothetical protein n=1 Tax=Cellulomonas xiejunii TaxID=2968083 RepID=UPI001D0F17BD|nr:hypothetical protein [Cellulomonas xiejunii]MCC2312918.1 hypothetical protein [Cellulomonas xiejunii]